MHLAPHLGKIELTKLTAGHVAAMFAAINTRNEEIRATNQARHEVQAVGRSAFTRGASRDEQRELAARLRSMPPFARTTGVTTCHHIHATLRAALNIAMDYQLIDINPAAHYKLPPSPRPRALVWTPERIEHWQRTGEKPSSVMLWTPQQIGRFLDAITDHPLAAMFQLIAYRGLRRGEACRLRRCDYHPQTASITVEASKTAASNADVALDQATTTAINTYLATQARQRQRAGTSWIESGRLFTQPDGTPINPNWLFAEFQRMTYHCGLPPIRLHDLRHGAATYAHASGADLKTISAMLRHSGLSITADTYTTVLPETAYQAAEAIARLIPRTHTPKKPHRSSKSRRRNSHTSRHRT